MEPWNDRVYVQHKSSGSTLFAGTVEEAHLWMGQYDQEALKRVEVVHARRFTVEDYLNCEG